MKNTSKPRYSVLMPVCNGRAYLKEAIQSVLNQTLTDFELIICDDLSDDDSLAIIREFKDPRILVLTNAARLGLFSNVNRAMTHARGEYLRVLCQDDLLFPEALARETAFFESHPDVGMVLTKSKMISETGEVIAEATLNDLPDRLFTPLAMQHYFYHGCIPGNLSGAAFKRSTIDEVGEFDPHFRVSGDYEMWVRICERFPMGLLHQHVVAVRFHPHQLSRRKSSGVLFVRENREIRRRAWKNLPPKLRAKAMRYERIRHGTLEFHWAIRSLLAGRPQDFISFCRILKLKELACSLFYWLITVNNRLYYPQATWIVP